ncbi:hypothetical protein D9756_009983 [Leucocoprinus leucothites]|uniref:F-box domain-containing protein n=1 Tax=Leucocoprinus leucothites TaxID=201217 RepID=A0A8H5CUE8_9AGAR|nr:hypothetical protein D9756_009983 [Leucoagaricus leucothites]
MSPLVSKSSLRAFHPPTDSEIATTRKALQEGLDHLQALENDISRLEKLYNDSLTSQQALTTFISTHKSLISPLNQLPPDLLCEIFHHCLPIAHNAIMSIHQPPLSLTLVCKKWRHLVYSTPQLWATLHIVAAPLDFRPIAEKKSKATLDAINAWLSRSGVLPLSISMYHCATFMTRSRTMNYQVQPYLDIILSHSHRCKSLYFIFHSIDWTRILSQFHRIDLPLLEHLYIKDHLKSVSWVEPEDPTHNPISAFAQEGSILRAPRLHTLDLPSYIAHKLGESMPWHHLTSLSISYWTFPYDEFSHIASQCPNLLELSLKLTHVQITSTVDGHATFPLSPPQIVFPSLLNFMIHGRPADDCDVCDFFEFTSTPSLIHLTWGRSTPSDTGTAAFISALEPEFIRSLSLFLAKLVNPLEELDLWLDPISLDTLIKILQLVPKVKRLSLEGFTEPHVWGQGPTTIYQPSSDPVFLDDSILEHFIPHKDPIPKLDSVLPVLSDNDNEDDTESGGSINAPNLPCLCPNLEILYFPRAQFSNTLLLKFIRSRTLSHLQNNVSRLRHLKTRFFRPPPSVEEPESEEPEEPNMQMELTTLEKETGVQVYLEHHKQPKSLSPSYMHSIPHAYDGIDVGSPAFYFQPYFVH